MSIETDWKIFYTEGKAYHKTACGAISRPKVFTPEIMLNLIGMAIEKYLMAVFICRSTLPNNHTMEDLAAALLPGELNKEVGNVLSEMDDMQQICSVDHIITKTPRSEDIVRYMKALDSIAVFAKGELETCVT